MRRMRLKTPVLAPLHDSYERMESVKSRVDSRCGNSPGELGSPGSCLRIAPTGTGIKVSLRDPIAMISL